MGQRFRLAILISHPIQYFAPLYRRLAQEPGIDMTVYFCSRQGVHSYDDEGFGTQVSWDVPLLEGYRHKFLPNVRRKAKVGRFFSLVNVALVGELWRNRYDALLVNGHMYFSYLLGIIAAKLVGIPVFMRCETHLLLRRSGLKLALRRYLMRLFYRHFCDRCLAIGTRNRAFYRAHGVSAERLFDVPYVVDNAFFVRETAPCRARVGDARLELDLPVDKPLILYASKLIPRKRPHDLLAAFHRLREGGIEAALVFVGSGVLEPALKEYADQHRVSDVYFAGFRNQSELPQYYDAADIFVLPSEDEPWGLVINESMCAGLPVVASEEIGAVPDLVRHGYNGFTFPAGDVEQLADHLRELVRDEGVRRDMGEKSLEIIRGWDLERCVEGILAALKSLPVKQPQHSRC
jgi:glycosyltransferase involved in cell wall biosynthesis